MEIDYSEIGRNIRECRLKMGLKQKELAESTNVTPQHISHIETGHAQVSLPTLVAISNALKVDCNTLLGETLTGSLDVLRRHELEDMLSKLDDKKLLLYIQLCRLLTDFEV